VANNGVSRGSELLMDGDDPFIRIRLGPGSFALRSPDLPADASPIKGVRIVYRWQPSDARHPLNVFLAIAVPWQKVYEGDQALLRWARSPVVDRAKWKPDQFSGPALRRALCLLHR